MFEAMDLAGLGMDGARAIGGMRFHYYVGGGCRAEDGHNSSGQKICHYSSSLRLVSTLQ